MLVLFCNQLDFAHIANNRNIHTWITNFAEFPDRHQKIRNSSDCLLLLSVRINAECDLLRTGIAFSQLSIIFIIFNFFYLMYFINFEIFAHKWQDFSHTNTFIYMLFFSCNYLRKCISFKKCYGNMIFFIKKIGVFWQIMNF